jgi:hypothetical protein
VKRRKAIASFGGILRQKERERASICILHYARVLPGGDPASPSLKGFYA